MELVIRYISNGRMIMNCKGCGSGYSFMYKRNECLEGPTETTTDISLDGRFWGRDLNL